MNNIENEFFVGAMWAASTIWRLTTDAVVVKDFLNELPDVHEIAKICTEHDIQPLRLNAMSSLPLGYDASYVSISYGPISSLGEVICDHNDTSSVNEKSFDSFGVYAVEEDKTLRVLVSGLYSEEEAEGQSIILEQQLLKIKTTTDKLHA